MPRIKMPDGHIQLALAGVTYDRDEEGCFVVPDAHVEELIRVHGAEPAPSAQEFEQRAIRAEEHVTTLSQQLTFARAQARGLREQANAANTRHTEALEAAAAAAEAKAKAARELDAEAAAEADKQEKARLAVQAAAGTTAPTAAGQRVSIPRVPAG